MNTFNMTVENDENDERNQYVDLQATTASNDDEGQPSERMGLRRIVCKIQ